VEKAALVASQKRREEDLRFANTYRDQYYTYLPVGFLSFSQSIYLALALLFFSFSSLGLLVGFTFSHPPSSLSTARGITRSDDIPPAQEHHFPGAWIAQGDVAEDTAAAGTAADTVAAGDAGAVGAAAVDGSTY
jgi:hypothetical protein